MTLHSIAGIHRFFTPHCSTGSPLASLLFLLASGLMPATIAYAANVRAQAWITTDDHRMRLQPVAVQRLATPIAHPDIRIDSSHRMQSIVGFGAAMTDASSSLLLAMPEPRRDAAMRYLFSRNDGGLGFDFTRIPIGASDFSSIHYSLDDPPGNLPDLRLQHYRFDHVRDTVIPLMRQAHALNPDLKVMASPWSAPGWMKDSDSLIKGTLRPEYVDAFATYLARFAHDMDSAGVPLFALTIQNEPSFEPGDYPGMRLSAKQRVAAIAALGPRLPASVQILEWDHNWDKPDEPLAVLSEPAAARYVRGIAWHCYGGNVDAQSQVHDRHPQLDAYLTECSGGDWEPVRSNGISGQTTSLVIAPLRNWARGVLFWNLALDDHDGPHLGGCGNCRGIIAVHPDGRFTPTDDAWALAHASRFIRAGAVRVASSGDAIDQVAVANPDGSRVVVAANTRRIPRTIILCDGNSCLRWKMPARSVATVQWPGMRR
ncbi:glycoside hydrolase family 30 protein [Solilutibacter silvestris]|uniref:O-Glycosyl hydrolase family 30 n=1 Tax=Solilutibacter silvestris TaxID=1645665 RepID=A0A2K1PX52_9GAMM|nr:glycoside hydrolase family 30 beta sandwich domain-containing protein [Lysobacter silvestris]PNS07361.1 O-Glycosyl hydrolase family 30 [Lysobacter silvestris]